MLRWTTALPIPAAYFELAVRVFGRTPAAVEALRGGTGATSKSPGGEMTLGQQLEQIRILNRLEPPGWGLVLGNRLEVSTHGPVGFAAVSAPTLAGGIAVIARFGHVRMPHFRFEFERDQRQVVLRVDQRIQLDAAERIPLLECLMLSLQKLVESVLGGPMTESAIRFPWPPPSYAGDYRDCFHGAVRFHARQTELAFSTSWLSLESPFADPVTHAESMRALEALERRLEGDDYVAARVEQIIAAAGDGVLSLEEVARRTRLSTRTLIRRLRGAGTTYQELLDAHRRERAVSLLAHPDFNLAEISHRLGYGDPANFGRACRRWFGMAPGQYRRTFRT